VQDVFDVALGAFCLLGGDEKVLIGPVEDIVFDFEGCRIRGGGARGPATCGHTRARIKETRIRLTQGHRRDASGS
jgi:hypothetical protein